MKKPRAPAGALGFCVWWGDFNRLYDEGESIGLDLSTSHSAGPPSLFPGTRLFLFVTAVAGKDKRRCVPLHLQSLLHLPVNILLYPLKIPPYFPIGNPDDFISQLLDPPGPQGIPLFFHRIGVLLAIQFYNQLCSGTVKIGDIIQDDFLTAEAHRIVP